MKRSFLLFNSLLIIFIIKTYSSWCQQTTFTRVVPPFGNFAARVGAVTQDPNGYIWIATTNGLYKYDGYRFILYTNDPANTNSLSSSHLETVYADSKGMIWIATWINGLDRFDPLTGSFTHFQHDPNNHGSLSNDTVRAILEDHNGVLWIGTYGGLNKYDPVTGKFQNYHYNSNDPYSLSCNKVRKIYEDRQGTLWVGSGAVWATEGGETNEGGLNRFEKPGKFIRYLNDPGNPHSLFNNKVQAIFEDSRGIFWVGSAGDQLQIMNRSAGTFEQYAYDASSPQSSKPSVKKRESTDYITCITEDALKNIWIGTLRSGLNYYDPKTQKTVHFDNKDTAIGFTDNSGWSLYNSRDGILWISTWEGGLYRMDPYNKKIPHVSIGNSVWAFNEDQANNLWIGTSQGIFIKNKITGKSKNFVFNEFNRRSLSGNDVYSIYRDQKGIMWVATNNGLNRFNASSNTFTRYQNNTKDNNSISAGAIYTIKDAGSDSLWIGTTSGLDLLNKSTSSLTHFKNEPKDTNTLTKGAISTLITDKLNNVWAGVFPNGGLNKFDAGTGKCSHFLKGISVLFLLQHSDGTLWAGTGGQGLFRSNPAANGFIKFAIPASGIEKSSVNSILEDDQKNIWVSTTVGIFRINPKNNNVTILGSNSGINAGNLSFLAGYKSEKGDLYFGDLNGYYIISPDKLISNPTPPQIAFTDFRLGDKSILPGKNSPLTEPLENVRSMRLRHNQNVFSFDFAAIHYSNPAQNRQLYMLENYDPVWREAGTEKTAFYFNVPPGRYTFKVKAASNEGIWAERAIEIIILQVWWQTWWAYTTYALFVTLLIWLFFRYRLKQIHMEHAVLLQQKETQQLKAMDEIKTRFFSNITHEFRTPLSLIISPVEKLQQQTKEENTAKTLSSVQRNAQQLLRLVNQLLDMSKLETGSMKVNYSYGGLGEFVQYMTDNFSTLAERKNIEIRCINTLSGDYIFDAEKLETILFNLLSNAIKFTLDNGKVIVSAEDKGMIRVEVSDTGIGIPAEKLSFIFNRFYQADDSRTRQFEGTGIGLALVKELIELIGGSVTATSKQDEGTTFTIKFPAEKWSGQMLPQWQKNKALQSQLFKEDHNNPGNEENQIKNEKLPLVLLVEDNEELLSFLKESLQNEYRIITATKGVDALYLAQEELPDIMISDVMMPGMDGYTLCEKVKKNIITNHIAVILLTAKVSHESHMHGLMMGADDYINKPFHLDELQARITNLINRQEKLKSYYQHRLKHTANVKQEEEVEDPFLKTIYAAIEECINDTQFDVPALAVKCAVSQRTLNRKLNALLGLPANIVIRQYRLQKSISLLKKGFSVSETAYSVGFETPSYYSQCFKEQYGVPPKEYVCT